MQPSGYFVDANLLVLFVVGSVDSDYIPKYKRTRSYTVEDYNELRRMLENVKERLVTPNILTETSNMLCDDKRFVALLRDMIQTSCVTEIYVESRAASKRGEFEHLGLTDCGLLELVTPKTPLLTADYALVQAARESDLHIVKYFHTA